MKRLLLFGGTAEGRALALRLAALPLQITVCVATGYGEEALQGLPPNCRVHTGRMDSAAMGRLMARGYSWVVDATHPYAVAVSANIQRAAQAAGLPCLRLLRGAGTAANAARVANAAAAAQLLRGSQGNVLLATGSKDLAAYTGLENYAQRLYVRVLPSVESITGCLALGYRQSHIIAMQGPFSLGLNLALMQQLDIRCMVTKDGGAAGGFEEKMQAAQQAGVYAIVIGRPAEETGLGFEQVARRIEEEAGV